jgi:hypothetical protein
MRATNDIDRAKIARDAELLADRAEENLPGAPQSWRRTNLFAGEDERSTPATTYGQELAHEAEQDWKWVREKASGAADAGKGLAQWLLIGGGILVAAKLADYLRTREQRRATGTARALNEGLERTAADAEQIIR